MCLGIPAKIIEIENSFAKAQFGEIIRDISLDIVDQEVSVGDYVIIHAGFAIHKIDEEEAKKSLEFFQELMDEES
jgi:hydrogenase expression/formation protein HypC